MTNPRFEDPQEKPSHVPWRDQWNWTDNWQALSDLNLNAWNNISVTVPSNAALPLSRIGIEFTSSAAWDGTIYLDSVGP